MVAEAASLALAGRIVLLGFERVFVKRLGRERDTLASTALFFLASSALVVPIVAATGFEPHPRLWFGLASGLVYAVAFVLYVYSLSRGEASLVTPLYNLNVFFLLLFGFAFLGEPITPLKVTGLALLVLGAGLLEPRGQFLVSFRHLVARPSLAMLGTSALVAVGRTMDGFAVRGGAGTIEYAAVIVWATTGYVALAALLRGRAAAVRGLVRERPWDAAAAGFCNVYSYMLLLVAFLTFDISVAEPASMLGALVTIVASRWLFGEKVGFRLLGAAVMVGGAVVLFLPGSS